MLICHFVVICFETELNNLKSKLIVASLLLMILSLNIHSVSSEQIFYKKDRKNDVTYFDVKRNTILKRGNFHGEVDIVFTELIDEYLKVTFKDAPILDRYHIYSFEIIWELGATSLNHSYGQISGPLTNSIGTNLYDSQGSVIIQDSVDSVINISDKTIFFPICSYSLLSDPTTPDSWKVSSIVYVNDSEDVDEPILIYSSSYYNDSTRDFDIIPYIAIGVSLFVICPVLFVLIRSRKFAKK